MGSMNMQSQEQINEIERLYAETVHKVETGGIARGKIVEIKGEGVVVDVGYKSEGLIPASEFGINDFLKLKKGDEIEVFVERINHVEESITLSRDKAMKIASLKKVSEHYKKNLPVDGTVVGKTKGGLIVDILGIKAFLPASQVDVRPVKDIDQYIGHNMALKIIKFNIHGDVSEIPISQFPKLSLTVSRKLVIEEERMRKKEETLKVLKEGSLVKGTVKNITDYGVFVDLGGIDGLLHISDISWRRVNHPSEFFSEGEEKEFVVLKYDEATEKITLGYKQKKPDPWLTAEERYKHGMKVIGKVVNVTDYGAFVEVEDGLEGLIHVSEMDWTPRPKHPSKYVSIGEDIEAAVISINSNERRLSLSIKHLKPRPWDLVGQRYNVGQRITGRVKTITDFGVFVRLPEGVDGLIHISDLSWTRHIKHPSEVLRKGQKIEAVVLSLDPERERIALGLKQLEADPWLNEIPARFPVGTEVTGKIIKVVDFGVFVELPGGVEGLVYSSEIDTSRELREGDTLRVRVIKMNPEERKIGLSMKNIKGDARED